MYASYNFTEFLLGINCTYFSYLFGHIILDFHKEPEAGWTEIWKELGKVKKYEEIVFKNISNEKRYWFLIHSCFCCFIRFISKHLCLFYLWIFFKRQIQVIVIITTIKVVVVVVIVKTWILCSIEFSFLCSGHAYSCMVCLPSSDFGNCSLPRIHFMFQIFA